MKNLKEFLNIQNFEIECCDQITDKTNFGCLIFEKIRDFQHLIVIFDRELNITFYSDEYFWISKCDHTDIFEISKDQKYGIIDAYGNEILPCIYDHIDLDTEGMKEPDMNTPFLVSLDNKDILFDRKGNQLGEPHKNISSCFDDYCTEFADEDGIGHLDRSGNVIYKIPYKKFSPADFLNGKSKYKIIEDKDFNKGIIDYHNGKILYPVQDFHRLIYIGNDIFLADSNTKGIQIIDLKDKL